MPNSRFYTSQNVKSVFDYAFTKIDFKVKELTRDTGCSIGIHVTDDKYVTEVIQQITGPGKDYFNDRHNSHDWAKMLKHVFQNGQIINFFMIDVFKEWKEFSKYSRDVFAEIENPDREIEYVTEFKKFVAKLVNFGAVEEANCIHQFLYFAYKVFSEDVTQKNTSEKVANMLGGTFYDALQLEGMVKNFKLTALDESQTKGYVQRVEQSSCFLKKLIEDPLFSTQFNKKSYAQYLIIPKPEKGCSRKTSQSVDSDTTLDPELVKRLKEVSLSISKSTPVISTPYEEITPTKTFSYSSGKKIQAQLKEGLKAPEENFEIVEQEMPQNKDEKTPKKKRASFGLFSNK